MRTKCGPLAFLLPQVRNDVYHEFYGDEQFHHAAYTHCYDPTGSVLYVGGEGPTPTFPASSQEAIRLFVLQVGDGLVPSSSLGNVISVQA